MGSSLRSGPESEDVEGTKLKGVDGGDGGGICNLPHVYVEFQLLIRAASKARPISFKVVWNGVIE